MIAKTISSFIIIVCIIFIFFNESIANIIQLIGNYLPNCTKLLRDIPKLGENNKFIVFASFCSIFSAIWGKSLLSLLSFMKSKYKDLSFGPMNKSKKGEIKKLHSSSGHDFDILLCYQDKNKVEVEKIEKDIKEAGYKSWNKDSLPAGIIWKERLKEDINNIKSAALFVGEEGDWPWVQDRELWNHLQKISNMNRPIIPVILKSCKKGHDEPPALVEGAIAVDFNKDSDPIKRLLEGIPEESGIGDEEDDDDKGPFRGPLVRHESKPTKRRERLPKNPYLEIESVIVESRLQICIKSNLGIETSETEVDLNHHFFSELARGIRFYPVSEDWIDSANLLGVELMKSLTDKSEDIGKAYNTAMCRVDENEDTEKLHLIFSGNSDTLSIPWELCSFDEKHYLAENYPISRNINFTSSTVKINNKSRFLSYDDLHYSDLNILFIEGVSDERQVTIDDSGKPKVCDLPELKHVNDEISFLEEHFRALNEASDRDKKIYFDKASTLGELEDKLSEVDWHIIHYAGHALCETRCGIIIHKEGEYKEADAIYANDLPSLIEKTHNTLKFVYLSCCEGATTYSEKIYYDFLSSNESKLGVMKTLIDCGVPSVLGYRWKIKDGICAEFAKEFYKNLFHNEEKSKGRTLRHALFDTRKKILQDNMRKKCENHNVWTSPIPILAIRDEFK
ncbi:CHAT domain-containing protein [Desulfonema magnum]|nr:CHAT domain-containing protein [Desulfonema magnum]